jgi:hypothetical protein
VTEGQRHRVVASVVTVMEGFPGFRPGDPSRPRTRDSIWLGDDTCCWSETGLKHPERNLHGKRSRAARQGGAR